MEYEQIMKRYVCRFCKGSFDQPENLYKHVQQIHTVRTSTGENRTCFLCGVQCSRIEDYRNHLRHIHGLNEEGQAFSFKCFNDFLLWKNETEKRNYCKFVMQTLPRTSASSEKVHIYQCDSSGSKKDRKGFVAVKDSCPAMISAVESAKTRGVKVEYWNNHIGHQVPVEGDELDAAINSLQVPEIVLGDDQRFHNDSATNIYLVAESNDGSLSDSVGNETPKPKKSLFMKNSNQSTSDQSRPELQRFSFRKDPSKKMPSFQYSLASVACMKPKPKPQKCEESIAATSIIENDNPDSSDVTGIQSQSELEESIANIENSPEDNTSVTTIIKLSTPKSPEKEKTPILQSTVTPITKSSTSITQSNIPNLNLVSDGIASGQYVILNSVPGENGVQNLLLCPVSTSASSGNPSTSAETKSSKQSEDSSVIIISPTGEILAEKENTSSVQNVPTVESNTLPISVENSLSTGQSLLKKAKPKKFQPKKLQGSTIEKSFTSSPNKLHLQQSPLFNNIKSISTLAASNKPATTITPILVSSVGSTISTPTFVSSVASTSKPTILSSGGVPRGKTLGLSSSTLNKFAHISSGGFSLNKPTDAQNFIAFNLPAGGPSPRIVNNNLCGPFVGQTVLHSGQTFMTFNNNLLPIGSSATSFLSPNMNSGYIIPSPVAKSPLSPSTSKPGTSQVTTTSGATTTCNVDAVNQIMSSIGKTLPPNAVPIIIIPGNENDVSSPPSSVINPILSNPSKTVTSPAASMPLIRSSVQSTVSPQITSCNRFVSSVLPGGSQVIPAPVPSTSKFRSSLLSQTPKSSRSPYVPKTTFIPSVSKPMVSTTDSSTVQFQSARASTSSNVTTRSICFTSTPTLQSNALSSIVLNSEPISSTPAINIPNFPRTTDKPGTLYLKSCTGGIYRLESVEESAIESSSSIPAIPDSHSDRPLRDKLTTTALGKVNNPVININSKSETSVQEVNGKSFMTEDKANPPVITIEADENESGFDFTRKLNDPVQSHLEVKVDRKLKTPSPRKTPEFRNGVQIKSVVQDKRPFKEDDVEILKKVKYYQMEMKYLSSQAECKRLKLELAKAKMKSEALTNKETIVITNVESKKDGVIDEKFNKPTKCDKLDSTFSMDIDKEKTKGADDIVKEVMGAVVAKVDSNIECEDEQSMDIEFDQATCDDDVQSTDDDMNTDMDQAVEITVEQKIGSDGEKALPIPESKSLEITELAQQVMVTNNPGKENVLNEQAALDLHPEEGMSTESLKSLEDQYGKQSSLDIYTMIRTSVLRNLYEDMKGLCEENKKLFEELQKYRAHNQLLEILDEDLHEE